MKVVFFSSDNDNRSLEIDVNNFIATHKVIDIKFSSSEHTYDVMIVYKDE